MKAMVVRTAKQPMVFEERETPKPGPGQVRIKVHACGICFSDHLVTDGVWPGVALPRIPGHEVAGVIDAIGDGVTSFRPGERVGIGWHGGHDGTCEPCLRGLMLHCRNGAITGITMDGGYGEYLVAPAVAVARIPEGMGFAEAAPLLCAGVTTFNALRHSVARAGDLVGVQGLGGLGHLGVQYARAMGFEVVAISRGAGKEEHARKLGAHHFIDSERSDFAAAMTALGGARVILATAPSAPAISKLVPALGLQGCLLIVAAPFEPIQVSALDLIGRDARIQGWASGTASDSSDAMAFAQKHGIKAIIETFPLREANAALGRTMSGAVRFRSVLRVAES